MKTSPKGITALAAHEGCVLGVYKDSVGVLTYGIGHTAAAGGPDPATMVMQIDQDAELKRAISVFADDLVKYETSVNKMFGDRLNQHQFDAAVSFHYNTGGIGRATWAQKYRNEEVGVYRAAELMMNWRKPPEIIPRRESEARLFAEGVYYDAPITLYRTYDDYRHRAIGTISAEDFLAMVEEARRGSDPDPEVAQNNDDDFQSLTSRAASWIKGIIG